MRSALVGRTLAVVGGLGVAIAAYDALFGGFSLTILDVRISSREAYKPLAEGVICIVVALWLHDPRADAVASWNWIGRHARLLGCVATASSVILSIRYGAFVAGGSDAYGYVSEAARWQSGQLIQREPLADLADSLGASLPPLGYRPAATPGWSVPIYSPGLPLMMALTSTLSGPNAVYLVVPILGAVAVWLTYLLGERVSGRRVGLLAATALACSPIFIFQTLQPLSDVPATAWWLAAWVLIFRSGRATAWLAGLAASAAILTRPNLVPLAAVLFGAAIGRRPGIARGVWFAAGVVPGCLAVAVLNRYLYGSPLESGYGPVMIFSWERVLTNLQRYPKWLVQLQSPAALLAFAAPFVGRWPNSEDGAEHDARVMSLWMVVFCGVVLLCYLFYTPFGADEWPFLRFMLPAIPLLLILAGHVAVSAIARVPPVLRGGCVACLCALVAYWYLTKAAQLGVFETAANEHRYVVIGEYLGAALPSNAVVLTQGESGSVRWYGKRPTVRWDLLPDRELDRALDALRNAGYAPYILIEDWERNYFRSLFAARSSFGRMDWPPTIEYHGPRSVFVYSPDDRERSIRGETIATQIIPPG